MHSKETTREQRLTCIRSLCAPLPFPTTGTVRLRADGQGFVTHSPATSAAPTSLPYLSPLTSCLAWPWCTRFVFCILGQVAAVHRLRHGPVHPPPRTSARVRSHGSPTLCTETRAYLRYWLFESKMQNAITSHGGPALCAETQAYLRYWLFETKMPNAVTTHRHPINTVMNIEGTGLVATGDDEGYIRVRCCTSTRVCPRKGAGVVVCARCDLRFSLLSPRNLFLSPLRMRAVSLSCSAFFRSSRCSCKLSND